MHLLCLISSIVALYGEISRGGYQTKFKMQNRACRIVTFSNYETRSSILLDELGWESLENKRLKQLIIIIIDV